MCGIFCQINEKSILKSKLQIIKESLYKRGPDNSDFFITDCGKVSILHTRLAVQDISEAGNQPMISKDRRYILSYNGELYNVDDLKTYLKLKFNFVPISNSDTEILLNGLIFGVKFLELVDGIYSFVFLDNLKKFIF